MQVARLYLRGSLPNYTGKNLNDDQRADVSKIFNAVDEDPLILPSKSKFKRRLAQTIGGEYEESDAAELEWWTATWRAILSVTYHLPLECRCFGPVTINQKAGKRKGILYDGDVLELGDDFSIIISESLPVPPQHTIHICNSTESVDLMTNPRGLLTNPSSDSVFAIYRDLDGIRRLIHGPFSPSPCSHRTKIVGAFGTFAKTPIARGDILRVLEGPDKGLEAIIDVAYPTHLDLEGPRPLILGSDIELMNKTYQKIMNDPYYVAQGSPQFYVHKSLRPVHLILRSRRANPTIIFDANQMRKLVKNYGWEFIGQILKENKRTMIKTQIHIKDSADKVALKMVESLLTNSKESIKFEMLWDHSTVKTETFLLPMTIVQKIAELKREFEAYNVDVRFVGRGSNGGEGIGGGSGIVIKAIGDAPTITRKITEVRFNKMKSFDDKMEDDEKPMRESLETRIADKDKLTSHFDCMHTRDAFKTLFERLPDRAANFLSILMSPPPELCEKVGPAPRERDIADFMGVGSGDIKKYKSTIRLQMLALGMGPTDHFEFQT